MIRAVAAIALLVTATPVTAQCVWKWDCTGGQCIQVPLCRNSYDIPPPRPLELPPIPQPSIRPINPPALPPLGTRSCAMRYLCANGQCAWKQVCS